MTDRLDVLVVGARPVGLVLACHLRQLGLTVQLIEKRAGPSVHSKAIGLQYRVSDVTPQPIGLDDIRRFMTERAPDMEGAIVGEPIWLSDFRINCRMVGPHARGPGLPGRRCRAHPQPDGWARHHDGHARRR